MSSPRYTLLISKQSSEDIEALLLYTIAEWGTAQMVLYQGSLNSAMDTLTVMPYIGHLVDSIQEGYRVLRVKEHVIIYRIDTALRRVNILRVLHKRMDVQRKVAVLDQDVT